MLCRILIVFLLAFTPLAKADERSAEALQLQAQQLRARELVNQARIRELGGSDVSAEAKRTIAEDVRMLQDKADRLENIVKDLARTRRELEVLEQRTADGEDLTVAAVGALAAGVARNYIIKKTLEQAENQVLAKSFGVATISGAALGYVGAKIYRHLNAGKIRKMVEAEEVRLDEVRDLVSILRQTRNLRAEQLTEVEGLERDQEEILAELAKLNTLLDDMAKAEAKAKQDEEAARKPATQRDAMLDRDSDSEGDAEEQRQADFDNAPRLCDPSAVLKGAVGTAGTLPAQGPCRVIEGDWLLEYRNSKRQMPVVLNKVGVGEPVRYELTAKPALELRCAASGYDLTCEQRTRPPPTCPGVAWDEWQKGWHLKVATFGIEITGTWEVQKVVINPPDKPCYLDKPPSPIIMEFKLIAKPGGKARPG